MTLPIDKGEIGEISMKGDHEVEWSFENFCSSYTAKDEVYCSPLFTVSGSRWRLGICPNGATASDSVGWISLLLMNSDEDDSLPISARFVFGVKKVDGEVDHLGGKMTWMFDKDSRLYGCNKFLERSTLTRRKSELLSEETLTLTFSVWTGKHFEGSGGLDTLSRDFADLFTSKKGSDATLMVQGKEFPIHKAILSARSPVLAAMFEADMKEKRTGLVQIEDCDPDAFQEFLTYIYSGKVGNVSCDAFELYRIADKYDVQDLKSECVLSIMANLSVENVLEAAIFANRFDESGLKEKIQEFFNESYDEIVSSTEWSDGFLINNATVANGLLKARIKKISQQKK